MPSSPRTSKKVSVPAISKKLFGSLAFNTCLGLGNTSERNKSLEPDTGARLDFNIPVGFGEASVRSNSLLPPGELNVAAVAARGRTTM
jgi:hypothetical protein